MAAPSEELNRILRGNSLSIALFALFFACLALQAVTGWFAFNQSLHDDQRPALAFVAYLRTGNFLDGAFSNWQAAVLQLAVLVAFSAVLRQHGAAHSRKSEPANLAKLRRNVALRDTPLEWLRANSLSLAFFAMFALFFVLHAVFGTMKHNEDQAFRHQPPSSLTDYVLSADFWFTVFQTWEAEFGAIGLYVVLSIFLRQEGSPESKPVGASDEQTGGPNE